MIHEIDLTEGKLVSSGTTAINGHNKRTRILPWMTNDQLRNWSYEKERRDPFQYVFAGNININDDITYISNVSTSSTWITSSDTYTVTLRDRDHELRLNPSSMPSSSTRTTFSYTFATSYTNTWTSYPSTNITAITTNDGTLSITYTGEPIKDPMGSQWLLPVRYACDAEKRPKPFPSFMEEPRKNFHTTVTFNNESDGNHLLFFNDPSIDNTPECRDLVVQGLLDGYSRSELEDVLISQYRYDYFETYEEFLDEVENQRREKSLISIDLLDPNSEAYNPFETHTDQYIRMLKRKNHSLSDELSRVMPWLVDELRDIWRSSINMERINEYMSTHWHEITNPVLRDQWFHFNSENHKEVDAEFNVIENLSDYIVSIDRMGST